MHAPACFQTRFPRQKFRETIRAQPCLRYCPFLLQKNIMLTTLKNSLLSFAGLFGYSAEVAEEKAIEAAVSAPTEGNIDAVIIDAKAVVEHLDKNVPVPVVEAAAALAIAVVGFGFAPSVKGATIIGGEILTQLPIINPKWSKISPAHATAFIQALSDIEGDYNL